MSLTHEQIAQISHDANASYCKAIGDNSQVAWESAPEWQRASAINGVKFHSKNSNVKPSDSHDSWLTEKEADGWKYGPIKNSEKKEHPCYVPYDQLPEEQKVKDYLYGAVVKTLLKFT